MQRSPDPLLYLRGPTSKGREGERGRGREGERKGNGRVGEGRKGRDGKGREGREGNGSMHPLGFSKVGAYGTFHDPAFALLGTIPACDGRTDRRTDTLLSQKPR